MDEKIIRFIDSDHNELFTIPDGGRIVVTSEDGEQQIWTCEYQDERHFGLDAGVEGNSYHIHMFAEIMESKKCKVEPEAEPEIVGGSYRIIHRIPVGDKVYVMGHSPKSPQPYATWQAYRNHAGKDWGHYWSNRWEARNDLLCRADAERTGIPYDHTKKYEQKNRNDAR